VKEAVSMRVTNVSRHGFRICIGEREVHASFRDFPWFEGASIREIATVELVSPRHLHWPELDVDLAVDSLQHPERYPLVSRSHLDAGSRRDLE
jgi:hypothetical protein